MILPATTHASSVEEATLFAFDDHAFPFQQGVGLRLRSYQSPAGGTRIVVQPGPTGAPDSSHVIYYGAVIEVRDELWMWYLGQAQGEPWHGRVCFAKSSDGYHWEKPSLGLVEYKGSRDNNLVDICAGELHIQACVVLHEPDDPDPSRRFKMAFESVHYKQRIAVAFSEDGLTWREPPNQPVGPWFEMAGVTKVGDFYTLCGQGGRHEGSPRQFSVTTSYDFETWTDATCVAVRRDNLPGRRVPRGGHDGEQIHLGAGLWNRGNVILGLYGQWHGHPTNDRRFVTMDLGLAVSNDGLHYREPVPDFPMVSAGEDGFPMPPEPRPLTHYALIQGQGFANVGDETLFWYAPWPEHRSNGVRVARWPKDRLGCLRPMQGTPADPDPAPHVISAPIALGGRPAHVHVNVAGLTIHARMTVELLTERFTPIPGHSSAECDEITNGFRSAVSWRRQHQVPENVGPVRIRINFQGVRPDDVQLYAAYVQH